MSSLKNAIDRTYDAVRDRASIVKPTRWQSMDVSKQAAATTHEVLNHTLRAQIESESLADLANDVCPNLPWADDHFLERVGGLPLNPGVEWARWPWGNSANSFRSEKVPVGPSNPSEDVVIEQGQHGEIHTAPGFSHTYAERMWPKLANMHTAEFGGSVISDDGPHRGIRYPYGDARDVVAHLLEHPDSRQAYLPIWFPEDTGKTEVRVPCTLGYHFIQRHGYLHMTYYIRSCDLYRHFRDDVYLSVRLQLWMLDQLRKCGASCEKTADQHELWRSVKPGMFTMHIVSLHCFVNDYNLLWPKKVK